MNDALRRQREYQERKLKKGYVRTCAWIPERDLERVRTYVARLNRAFEREQGGRR